MELGRLENQQLQNLLLKSKVIDKYISLDSLSALDLALNDSEGFIKNLPSKTAIDEIQRAPQLIISIKKI